MAADAIYQVKATALNLRAAPDGGAVVIAVMPRDTFCTAVENVAVGTWLHVRWNAFTGFASGKYLAPVSGTAPPPTTPSVSSGNVLRRDNALEKLHPDVRDRVTRTVAQLNNENIPFRVFEASRTPERQADLYAQGRTKPGLKVTNAQPWQSYHQYGLAADLVLFESNTWSWSDAGARRAWWDRMTVVARTMGLETLNFERPHVQLAGVQLAQLRQGQYPAGGDATWFDTLSENIRRWRTSGRTPDAPPPLDADRPPLPDA